MLFRCSKDTNHKYISKMSCMFVLLVPTSVRSPTFFPFEIQQLNGCNGPIVSSHAEQNAIELHRMDERPSCVPKYYAVSTAVAVASSQSFVHPGDKLLGDIVETQQRHIPMAICRTSVNHILTIFSLSHRITATADEDKWSGWLAVPPPSIHHCRKNSWNWRYYANKW